MFIKKTRTYRGIPDVAQAVLHMSWQKIISEIAKRTKRAMLFQIVEYLCKQLCDANIAE